MKKEEDKEEEEEAASITSTVRWRGSPLTDF
jgi:hypothetical protein